MQAPERAKTTYERWIEEEGLPVTEALGGIDDVTEIPLRPWDRLGGRGAFIKLRGTTEGGRGVYLGEIASGGALNPEKHMYEEVIYILRGRGLTEVWQDSGGKQTFEWGEASLFAPPLNAWHRLVNGGREPVLFLGVNNAPEIMDTFHNVDFVFNCKYQFKDRYVGQGDYFNPGDKRYRHGRINVWETNFIPDVRAAMIEDLEQKVSGGQLTQFEMSGNTLIGHISEWPTGRYHKAHYHGPGAVLLGLKGKGYVLLWPKEAGPHPFAGGHSDVVIKVDWKPGSIYSPPDGWYHQHFNTSPGQARHLAIRYGSRLYRSPDTYHRSMEADFVLTSFREGGTLIDYEDEDQQVRRMFEEALKQEGVECKMPAVAYR